MLTANVEVVVNGVRNPLRTYSHTVREVHHVTQHRLTNSITITHCRAFSIATTTKVTGSENFVGKKLLGAMSNIMVSTANVRQDMAGDGKGDGSVSCSDDDSSPCSWINM